MTHAGGVTGLDRVTVVYPGAAVALRDVTLLAEPGELLAVLGPSGSGKSSMLRAIAGLLPVRGGRVLIDGAAAAEETGRRGVAMVFEDSHLIPFLDVAKNMSFPLDLALVPAEETRERVQEQARGLRLTRLLPRKPSTLSHGERARVGIGRALVRAPRAFLLDEPLAHFDAGERVRMRQHLSEVVRTAGVTTFYVTHDQSEALAIGDRVAVLNAGAVVQVAPPRVLYDEPVNTFVADFVGTAPMAMLPARLVSSGGMGGYQVGARTLPTWAPVPPGLAGYRNRSVLLGLRAEDVHERPTADHGTLTGVVTTVELTGPHMLVGVAVGEHRLHARFGGRTRVRPGDVVTVGVDATRAHVFDPVTQRALVHPTVG
ncbi:MAG TPA: ABC transporter ATP-binding protein [Jatrophihabitans sp.]|nr:ABC transporter ATP-binding protein [Jatrophihabitans sp.]